MKKYELDQSGKIEDTARKTVLAFSNDHLGAITLSAKDKRRLQELFREIGAPKLFIYYVFSALIILLLKPQKISKIIIDIEYPGHEKTIESLIAKELISEIEWKKIGKNSTAHNVAYRVFSNKLKLGRTASAKEVWSLAKKITGGRLKIRLSPTNRRSAPVSKIIVTKKRNKSR